MWKLNTSNKGKLREFQRLMGQHGISLDFSQYDLPEIEADPIATVVHKASQIGEGVFVDDTSLDIEGEKIGTKIRWLIDNLSKLQGKKAKWTVLLAYQKEHKVYVYQGQITGTIVAKRGDNDFGFDPYFLPDGAEKTLAESKPDEFNARAKAVASFIAGETIAIHEPMLDWQGSWQRRSFS